MPRYDHFFATELFCLEFHAFMVEKLFLQRQQYIACFTSLVFCIQVVLRNTVHYQELYQNSLTLKRRSIKLFKIRLVSL